MFAEVPAKTFRRLVKKQATHTPRSPKIPALGQLMVRAAGESVCLSVNDLEVACEVEVPARVFVAGETTCNARKLKKIVHKLPKEGVYRLSGGEDENGYPALQVEADGAMFQVPGLPLEEVPEAPDPEGEPLGAFQVSGRDLKLWKRRIATAASTEDSRPILNGVLVEYEEEGGKLSVVATNGHRLLRYRAEGVRGWGSFQAILPRAFWKHTVRVCEDGETFQLVAFEETVTLDSPTVRFDVQQIEGPYPEYRQVLPRLSEATLTVDLDAEELSETAERVGVAASDACSRLSVRPRANGRPDGSVVLAAESVDGPKAQAQLDASVEGDPFRFGVNADYLGDCLYALDTETVRLRLASPERAIRLEGTERNGYDALLMPLRLLD